MRMQDGQDRQGAAAECRFGSEPTTGQQRCGRGKRAVGAREWDETSRSLVVLASCGDSVHKGPPETTRTYRPTREWGFCFSPPLGWGVVAGQSARSASASRRRACPVLHIAGSDTKVGDGTHDVAIVRRYTCGSNGQARVDRIEPTGDGLLVEWAHDMIRPKPLLSCATNGPTRSHPRPSVGVSGNVWNRRGTARAGCRERCGSCRSRIRTHRAAERWHCPGLRLSLGKSNRLRRPPPPNPRRARPHRTLETSRGPGASRRHTTTTLACRRWTRRPLDPSTFGPVDPGAVDVGPVDLWTCRLRTCRLRTCRLRTRRTWTRRPWTRRPWTRRRWTRRPWTR
jgi:hypothetical protein